MHHTSSPKRLSALVNTQTTDHAQERQEPMPPPRKGALPYTREEYRALPKDEKNPALDFFIEGILPDAGRPGGSPEQAQEDMDYIVAWCLGHHEDQALEFLYRETGSERLFLKHTRLDQRVFAQLQPTLKNHPRVRLHLAGGVSVAAEAVSELAKLIRDGRIVQLFLQRDGLGADSICSIAQALKSDGVITSMVFVGLAGIGNSAASALGEALNGMQGLKQVSFLICDFSTTEWQAICRGLQSDSRVSELTVAYCNLIDDTSSALGDALAASRSLKLLNLQVVSSDCHVDIILEKLGQGSSIETLRLQSRDAMQEETVQALARCVSRNASLKTLELTEQFPSDRRLPTEELAQAICMQNTTLLDVNLTHSSLAEVQQAPAVQQALQRNATLLDASFMREAAQSFIEQPFGSASWLPEGPGDVLAKHILKLEPAIPDFIHTMAHVELAAKEQIRQAGDHAAQ